MIPPDYDNEVLENITLYAKGIVARVGIPPITRRGNIHYSDDKGIHCYINWRDTDQAHTRRNKLWNEDPRCRNCNVVTILPHTLIEEYGDKQSLWPKDIGDRMTTIEHIHTRFDPQRKLQDGAPVTTLFCARCNNIKGSRDYAVLPLNRRRQLSGYYLSKHRKGRHSNG